MHIHVYALLGKIMLPYVHYRSSIYITSHYNTAIGECHEFVWEKWPHGTNGAVYSSKQIRLQNNLIPYFITMLIKFADISQSDCSNCIMQQVKDPCARPGWAGCLTWENSFH